MNPIDKLIDVAENGDDDFKAFTAILMLVLGVIAVGVVAVLLAVWLIATWPRAGGITFGCAAVWGIVKLYKVVTS